MVQPGAKNWIEKYFELVRSGEIELFFDVPQEITKEEYLHTTLFQSGLVFGFATDFIYVKAVETQSWTRDEKLKLLLFEGLLMIYLAESNNFNEKEFEDLLIEFYAQYKEKSTLSVFQLFTKETPRTKLENILKRRVHVRRTIKNQLWVNYLYNSLVFLDVLAFRQFLLKGKHLEDTYSKFAMGVLNTVGVASQADGIIESQEQTILDVFTASANIDEDQKKRFRTSVFDEKLSLSNIILPDEKDLLYKYYLIDIATMTVHSDLAALDSEIIFLYELCNYLGVESEKLHEIIILIEGFVIENSHKVTFLRESSSYDQLYGNFSKRWIKILGRNKDKFIEELRESKELISLVNKSLKEELTNEEKEKVKTQFRDLAKSMPALAIFMLPGGMLILPIILKIIPDLIPSAFKGNETKKDQDQDEV
ncbi:MAG: LETM1-related biofilm-associated protein [Brumimicrobium sp.]